jgi:hypothetical protein
MAELEELAKCFKDGANLKHFVWNAYIFVRYHNDYDAAGGHLANAIERLQKTKCIPLEQASSLADELSEIEKEFAHNVKDKNAIVRDLSDIIRMIQR